jgi:hypothetical protein
MFARQCLTDEDAPAGLERLAQFFCDAVPLITRDGDPRLPRTQDRLAGVKVVSFEIGKDKPETIGVPAKFFAEEQEFVVDYLAKLASEARNS